MATVLNNTTKKKPTPRPVVTPKPVVTPRPVGTPAPSSPAKARPLPGYTSPYTGVDPNAGRTDDSKKAPIASPNRDAAKRSTFGPSTNLGGVLNPSSGSPVSPVNTTTSQYEDAYNAYYGHLKKLGYDEGAISDKRATPAPWGSQKDRDEWYRMGLKTLTDNFSNKALPGNTPAPVVPPAGGGGGGETDASGNQGGNNNSGPADPSGGNAGGGGGGTDASGNPIPEWKPEMLTAPGALDTSALDAELQGLYDQYGQLKSSYTPGQFAGTGPAPTREQYASEAARRAQSEIDAGSAAFGAQQLAAGNIYDQRLREIQLGQDKEIRGLESQQGQDVGRYSNMAANMGLANGFGSMENYYGITNDYAQRMADTRSQASVAAQGAAGDKASALAAIEAERAKLQAGRAAREGELVDTLFSQGVEQYSEEWNRAFSVFDANETRLQKADEARLTNEYQALAAKTGNVQSRIDNARNTANDAWAQKSDATRANNEANLASRGQDIQVSQFDKTFDRNVFTSDREFEQAKKEYEGQSAQWQAQFDENVRQFGMNFEEAKRLSNQQEAARQEQFTYDKAMDAQDRDDALMMWAKTFNYNQRIDTRNFNYQKSLNTLEQAYRAKWDNINHMTNEAERKKAGRIADAQLKMEQQKLEAILKQIEAGTYN